MAPNSGSALSTLDYHVLLAIADGPLYGYAIRDAVEEESGGTLTPRAGSLYRVIARLMTEDLVAETDPPADAEDHPGRPRRYYRLTREGREAILAETRRLKGAAALAEKRLGVSGS